MTNGHCSWTWEHIAAAVTSCFTRVEADLWIWIWIDLWNPFEGRAYKSWNGMSSTSYILGLLSLQISHLKKNFFFELQLLCGTYTIKRRFLLMRERGERGRGGRRGGNQSITLAHDKPGIESGPHAFKSSTLASTSPPRQFSHFWWTFMSVMPTF